MSQCGAFSPSSSPHRGSGPAAVMSHSAARVATSTAGSPPAPTTAPTFSASPPPLQAHDHPLRLSILFPQTYLLRLELAMIGWTVGGGRGEGGEWEPGAPSDAAAAFDDDASAFYLHSGALPQPPRSHARCPLLHSPLARSRGPRPSDTVPSAFKLKLMRQNRPLVLQWERLDRPSALFPVPRELSVAAYASQAGASRLAAFASSLFAFSSNLEFRCSFERIRSFASHSNPSAPSRYSRQGQDKITS